MTTQHCPNCTDTDVRVDHAFHPADEAVYCERCDWEGCVTDLVAIPATLTPCGLNADCCVSAWLIPETGIVGNDGLPWSDGAAYLLDNEDDSFSIVRRYYRDDDNDRIDEIATFATFADAINGAIAMTATS